MRWIGWSRARGRFHEAGLPAPGSRSTGPGLTALPDLPPEPERQREVALRKRDHGSHGQGITGAVQCTGAARKGVGGGPAAALQRRERSPPAAGRGPLDRQHLAQIGPAAAARRALHVSRPARRATVHQGYSR